MEPVIVEWGSLLLRWTHVIVGMAWIGSSFHFMHLDASLRERQDIPKGSGGVAWEVHGGGFYEIRKYLVAPTRLPDALIWHKWQSYSTWVSGFFLLCWIYYGQSRLYLIDPSIMRLTPVSATAAVTCIHSRIAVVRRKQRLHHCDFVKRRAQVSHRMNLQALWRWDNSRRLTSPNRF